MAYHGVKRSELKINLKDLKEKIHLFPQFSLGD